MRKLSKAEMSATIDNVMKAKGLSREDAKAWARPQVTNSGTDGSEHAGSCRCAACNRYWDSI